MKKLIIYICVLVTLCGLFAGCDEQSSSDEYLEQPSTAQERFKTVYPSSGLSFNQIIVDAETGVMYLFHKSGYGGGLTVMVDENGKPMLWEDSN